MELTKSQYGEAYEKGYDMTVRFLLSRGVPGQSAEEAAQAAWARGWEKRGELRNAKTVVTWVNSIALNLFRNRLRKQRRMRNELPDVAKSPDTEPRRIDLQRSLRHCQPKEKALLHEYYVRGYTSAEIAKRWKCRPVAVRVRLLRLRRRLKQLLSTPPSKTPQLAGYQTAH